MGARLAHTLPPDPTQDRESAMKKHVIRWDKNGCAPLSNLLWKVRQATSSWYFLGNTWLAGQPGGEELAKGHIFWHLSGKREAEC